MSSGDICLHRDHRIAQEATAMTRRSILLAGAAGLASAAASPLAHAQSRDGAAVEIVASLDRRPANPAITPDGRLLFSQHPLDAPEFNVMEWVTGGPPRPFPNPEWSRDRLRAVIGMRAGQDGVVWMLDMGGGGQPPRLVGWDTRRDALHREIQIPAVATRPNSFLQDFALDQARNHAFIADMTRGDLIGESRPAIIVVDLASGVVRRVLEGHPTFAPEGRVTIDGRTLATRGADGSVTELALGLNPITIDPAGAWVYYGAVNGRGLWRMPAALLADAAVPEAALAARIERFGEKRSSDGISVDGAGNVYVTDVEAHAIGVASAGGYRILARDAERLRWADGLAFGPDGWLYATVNQLNLHPAVNRGEEGGRPPYYIVRIRPLAPGAVGR
jgi:sugar lactone lactonase YvrE